VGVSCPDASQSLLITKSRRWRIVIGKPAGLVRTSQRR